MPATSYRPHPWVHNLNRVWEIATLNWVVMTQPGGGGGGAGDASAANQTTEIARLTSILAALTNPLPVSNSVLTDIWNSVTHAIKTQNDVLTAVYDSFNQRLVVDGSQVTQPISAVALPLPALAATSTIQATQQTSLTSMDGKTPALGQALAAASTPVVLTAAQMTTLTPPAAITGFALETGGNLATTATNTGRIPAQGQALAAASLPVVLTAIQVAAITPPAAIVGFALDATLTGRTQKSQITDGTRDGTVKAASTLPLATDTAVVVTLRESLSTAVTNANLDVALSTRLKPADTLTGVTTVTTVTTVGTLTTITNPVTVTPPTLTKATQGSTGFSTQDLKDAGRVSVMITASVVSSATAETLITLTRSIGLATTGTGTSLSITTGKRFRIQAIAISARNSTGTTASNVTVNFRAAAAGATSASSPLQMHWMIALPASAVTTLFPPIDIPDGFEIDSNGTTNTFGMTITHPQFAAGTVVATFDITLIGYEY